VSCFKVGSWKNANIHISLDYQKRVFDMVCEQHEFDRTGKIAKGSGMEEHVASSIVQMAA
jgi:hypothetical protein